MTNSHVSLKGLQVNYKEEILKDIFLEIRKGEFVSIVGVSGNGKTTLLNAIAGLKSFNGTIRKPTKIGFVFQHDSLFPWMTVIENIAFGNENLSKQEISKIVSSIGLKGKEEFFPKQLSGGQQQRVAIARALAYKPELLLLDEPFSNLDSFTKLQMQKWLHDLLQKNKTTVILVTHDAEEAILLSDRIFALKNKTIEQEFTIPFGRPRATEIRFNDEFQKLKRKIIDCAYY